MQTFAIRTVFKNELGLDNEGRLYCNKDATTNNFSVGQGIEHR